MHLAVVVNELNGSMDIVQMMNSHPTNLLLLHTHVQTCMYVTVYTHLLNVSTVRTLSHIQAFSFTVTHKTRGNISECLNTAVSQICHQNLVDILLKFWCYKNIHSFIHSHMPQSQQQWLCNYEHRISVDKLKCTWGWRSHLVTASLHSALYKYLLTYLFTY